MTAIHSLRFALMLLALFHTSHPPFSFRYNGQDSSQFIGSWTVAEAPATPSEGGETHHFIYTDPATKLKVTADVRTYSNFDAIDWVLHFSNEGGADTPIIEKILPLDWAMPLDLPHGVLPVIHSTTGSIGGSSDFTQQEHSLRAGEKFHMFSEGGRSSSGGEMPYFNVQTGDHGVIGAIGWTGDWVADLNRGGMGRQMAMTAGMRTTHFLLHAGETVRSPRIVLLNWSGGDDIDAQNQWRRLVLAHYSPRDPSGHVVSVPLAYSSWGTEYADAKLKTLQGLEDAHVPFDIYWIDAGWYGNEIPPAGKTTGPHSDWEKDRGDWSPDPKLYPEGFKPIGDFLRKTGHGFLIWVEAETAMRTSAFYKAHQDWFYPNPDAGNPRSPELLNLGNPDARKSITDTVSNLVTEAGLTWYRQDFNLGPQGYWAAADSPDRVGISEIRHIEGLYQFWDDLRARHPGLQIDNCASGGRRLDIEAISRSVSLWRSDYECGLVDPLYLQTETQGLNGWVPLNAGIYCGNAPGTAPDGASLIYGARGSYSAGYVGTDRFKTIPGIAFPYYIKAVSEEFLEVRPYFTGDFNPMVGYNQLQDAWTMWQWDRPDLKSGIVILLRRPKSLYTTAQLKLRGIDPKANYRVEIRTGLEKAPAREISGAELEKMQVTIDDMPGSKLIFYREM